MVLPHKCLHLLCVLVNADIEHLQLVSCNCVIVGMSLGSSHAHTRVFDKLCGLQAHNCVKLNTGTHLPVQHVAAPGGLLWAVWEVDLRSEVLCMNSCAHV